MMAAFSAASLRSLKTGRLRCVVRARSTSPVAASMTRSATLTPRPSAVACMMGRPSTTQR
jgi:hypothetical protein